MQNWERSIQVNWERLGELAAECREGLHSASAVEGCPICEEQTITPIKDLDMLQAALRVWAEDSGDMLDLARELAGEYTVEEVYEWLET